ncbi:MAG: hypothetical protein IPK26_21735 [Planctomycetes bacterium]|nr:hypothetical protein [Planctomycetota bacterium]
MRLISLLLWAFAGSAAAQSWAEVDDSPTGLGPVVYDQVRARPIGFAARSATVWSLENGRWRQHFPGGLSVPGFPPTRAGLVVFAVRDAGRQQTVVVGEAMQRSGLSTWVANGPEFALVTNAALARRDGIAAAFDPIGQRVITFGGFDQLIFDETDLMEGWNGSQWTALAPAARPPARSGAAMATDPVRQRVVLFGGQDGTTLLDDTWEWNGQQWSARPAVTRPAARATTMVWDPRIGETMVLGGFGPNYIPLADCWSWNGTRWATRPALPAVGPVASYEDGAAAFVVMPGPSGTRVLRSTATGWTLVASELRPTNHSNAPLVWDPARNEMLMAGGGSSTTSDTWAWDGSWTRRATVGPGGRSGSAMAPLGGQMVLFGGNQAPWGQIADTWLWNGQSWTQQYPVPQPWPRAGHAMVGTGSQVLLFGGDDSFGPQNDTWVFDGTTWTELQPATSPSGRSAHGMAWDPLRQRVVLFGGVSRIAMLQDTFEWNGTTWLSTSPTTLPQAGGFPLTWSTATNRVLLVQSDAVWSWDGVDWAAGAPASIDAWNARAAWHPVRQRLLAYASGDVTMVLTATPADASVTATLCGGRPAIGLFGRPVPGTAPEVHVEGAPRSAALLIYGLAATSIPWAPGCFQEVTQVGASVAGVTDARGVMAVPLPIPDRPIFLGVTAFVQGAVIDAGPVFGGSLTGTLRLTVGD